MGKRVSIYVPDDLVGSIQEAAKMGSRSVSNYLVQLHKTAIQNGMGFIDEAGSISEEVYNSIKVKQQGKPKSHKSDIRKKVKKVVAERKSDWTNLLTGTSLAPK